MPSEPGQMLSHYRLIEKLGEGGMGVVWKALDTKLDREIAIKTLPEELAGDPERLGRFEREAKAIAALNHPNIVTVHSVEDADTPTGPVRFITMELVRGESLTTLIPHDGLPLGKFFELSTALTDAISVAHRQGITHRDLKPENIMVDEDGRLKVLDFGLAKLREEPRAGKGGTTFPTATVTQEGKILGTVSYMSPEQAEGKAVDHRSDIFSLGVVLYRMATGQRPFQGDTSVSIISSIIKDTPTPVTEIKTSLPNHLGRIVKRCLAKEPRSRYQSTLDLCNELRGLGQEVATGEISSGKAGTTRATGGRRNVLWIAGAAFVVLLAVIAVQQWRGRRPAEPTPSAGPVEAADAVSVAVLPFANMSPDEENEYFADGMTEELINALVRIEELRVPARTSVFALKGAGLGIDEIGRKLNVDHVLEGSVRKAGDRLRITAQLVKVEDGFHLWSETYDRRADDVFAIQEEIARAIVGNLKIRLERGKGTDLVSGPTENVEAYNLYLQGRHHWNRRTADGIEKAIDLFQRAIEIDPGFALAWSGLADSYNASPEYRGTPSEEAFPKAKEAALRAVAEDESLAEAHTSLAWILTAYEHDLEGAEREFRRSIELNPRYATAHHWYGMFLFDERNRYDDGIAYLRQAELLDPFSRPIRGALSLRPLFVGRYDEGMKEAREQLEQYPDYVPARWNLALGFSYKRMFDEAVRTIEGYRADGAYERERVALLAETNHLLGRHRRELEVALAARREHPEGAREIAMEAHARAALGETDEVRELFDDLLQSPELRNGLPLVSTASELLVHGHEEAASELFERTVEWQRSRNESERADDYYYPYALFAAGRIDEARETWRQLFEDPDALQRAGFIESTVDGLAGIVAALGGDRRTALEHDRRIAELNRSSPLGANFWWRAIIAARLGDHEKAIDLLRDALEHGIRYSRGYHSDVYLRPLWDDPAYQEMLAELGVPESAR